MPLAISEDRQTIIISGGYAVAARAAVRYTMTRGQVLRSDMQWVACVIDGDDSGGMFLDRTEARAIYDYVHWAARKLLAHWKAASGFLYAYADMLTVEFAAQPHVTHWRWYRKGKADMPKRPEPLPARKRRRL